MANNIPFDIQLEIIGCSSVKSLIHFRSVFKAWKISDQLRKLVVVVVPNSGDGKIYKTILSFGVCGEATDRMLVKITHIEMWSDSERIVCIPWQVEVFTPIAGTWGSSYSNLPCKSIHLEYYLEAEANVK